MTAVETQRATDIAKAGVPIKRLAILWAGGTGVAVLLVASTFLLAQEFANPLTVAGTGEITLSNVTGFTILGATVGATLAYVVGRFVRRPRPTFLAVILIALAGYAVVPLTAAESVQTAVWLNTFHVVVAVPVIGLLSRSLPGDGTSVEA